MFWCFCHFFVPPLDVWRTQCCITSTQQFNSEWENIGATWCSLLQLIFGTVSTSLGIKKNFVRFGYVSSDAKITIQTYRGNGEEDVTRDNKTKQQEPYLKQEHAVVHHKWWSVLTSLCFRFSPYMLCHDGPDHQNPNLKNFRSILDIQLFLVLQEYFSCWLKRHRASHDELEYMCICVCVN